MAINKIQFNARHGISVGTTPTNIIDNAGNATLGTLSATTCTLGATGASSLSVSGSAAFTLSPTGATPATNDNSTKLATTAYYIGQAGTASPIMNGNATVGTSYLFSRQDHVHASDTSRAPISSPTFTTQISITGGSVAANTPPVNITQTWANAPTTFTGILQNITDSGSASTSKLIDLQVGSISQFSVSKTGDLTLAGNLTINGTTTTINTATLSVADINIELGKVTTPTDTTANGGGITLHGTTDKTIIWDNTNANFTSNQAWNLSSGLAYKINNVSVLTSTTCTLGAVGVGIGALLLKGSTSGTATLTTDATASQVTLDKALVVTGGTITTGAGGILLGSGSIGSGSQAWIGGNTTVTDWFFNVPAGKAFTFGVNNGGTGGILQFDGAMLSNTGGTISAGRVGATGSLLLKGSTSGTATLSTDATASQVTLDKPFTTTGGVTANAAPIILTDLTAFNATSANPIVRLRITGGSVADKNIYEIRAYNIAGAGNQKLQFRIIDDANTTATTLGLWDTTGLAVTGSVSATTQLISTVAIGTAPLVVTSTTPVANLSIGGNAATATTAAACSGNAATVTTNANLTGDITSVGNATTLTNAPVIAKVLTGYTKGAGTVAATDSILQAIQKLDGNYDGIGSSKIQPIAASVGSNALTVTLNATVLDFRSSTLTSGTVNTRTISSPISIVVSFGSTLGTINATPARIPVLAIDNAGTIELAVTNQSGGQNLDETTLISTTAEGGAGAADSANVIYSTTARTNVPFRVVGYIEVTEATAGTWATAPSLIQGYGGQAMAAMQSLGYGQTWQNVIGSRSLGTIYYNTTNRPILVEVGALNSSVQNAAIALTINGVFLGYNGGNNGNVGATYGGSAGIVPINASYSASVTGGSLAYWTELR